MKLKELLRSEGGLGAKGKVQVKMHCASFSLQWSNNNFSQSLMNLYLRYRTQCRAYPRACEVTIMDYFQYIVHDKQSTTGHQSAESVQMMLINGQRQIIFNELAKFCISISVCNIGA